MCGHRALQRGTLPFIVLVALLASPAFGSSETISLKASNSDHHLAVHVDITLARYDITVDGAVWFHSGTVALFVNDEWYTYPQDNSTELLELFSASIYSGLDPIFGKYQVVEFDYKTPDTVYIQLLYVYPSQSFILFEEYFPNGANNTSPSASEKAASRYPSAQTTEASVLSSFPTFTLDPTLSHLANLTYLTFNDTFAVPVIGSAADGFSDVSGPYGGVPLVFWNSSDTDRLQPVIVVSPFSEFMTNFQAGSVFDNGLSCGVSAAVAAIPSNYTRQTILYMGTNGINSTLYEWGSILLARSGKPRPEKSGFYDMSNALLGYWTDNGAYYYYFTENLNTSSYTQTLADVAAYYANLSIPIGYFQLDSWWYYKSTDTGGVTAWVPMPEIFPEGIAALQRGPLGGRPLVVHNRYWAPNANYTANYTFLVEQFESLPYDPKFWPFILGSDMAKGWGVVTYEQDWLIVQYLGMESTQNNTEVAREWLVAMGDAAVAMEMTIQYCMPLPMFLLQSTEILAVTQTRVSNDYQPGNSQWNIGTTSLLAWSLGLASFKDNFWTTSVQNGNRYNHTEPNPILEAIVAALSAGPVGISDMIGATNATLVASLCTANGTLLKPDRPAVPLDKTFYVETMLPPVPNNTATDIPQLWSTTAALWDGKRYWRWAYVLAVEITEPYVVSPHDIGLRDDATNGFIALNYDDTTASGFIPFNGTDSLELDPVPPPDEDGHLYFAYWRIAPVFDNGWAFLGELNKIVPVSAVRFSNLTISDSTLSVVVNGISGEEVELHFLHNLNVVHVHCIVEPTNSVVVTCSPRCTCGSIKEKDVLESLK